ncbi:hypothetical protein IID10_20155 [candidate division KSB1 bacterium]|nr:hypothetical protein [candidate division KSB1 bacterium]
MNQKVYFVLCIVFALLLHGCYTLNQVGTPISERIDVISTDNPQVSEHFVRTKKIHHFVYGLVSPDDAGIEKLISNEVQLKGGTRAVNLKIKYQSTFVDGLVSALTFGLYNPFTLRVEGDIVK